jgi:hypothetical protein
MKAEVAKRYSDNANSINSRMKKIYDVIRASADAGLYFIILDDVDSECRGILIQNGYNLIDFGNGSVTIEW